MDGFKHEIKILNISKKMEGVILNLRGAEETNFELAETHLKRKTKEKFEHWYSAKFTKCLIL